jgi:hypothetical protein
MSNSTTGTDFTGGDGPGDRGAARASVHARHGAGGAFACTLVRLAGARQAPAHDILRPPEIGTVMVRGRAGAKGAPFNLGEMTVTRATVRLADGAVGHGHVQGRDKQAALTAALIDALCEAGEAMRAGGRHPRTIARRGGGTAPGPRSQGGGHEGRVLHHGAGRGRMSVQYLEGGFADPARQAAHAFRGALAGAEPPGPDRAACRCHAARAPVRLPPGRCC